MAELTQASSTKPASRRWAGLQGFSLSAAGIYYALALVWLVLTVCTIVAGEQNFLDPANLANILYQASFVAIIAVPMTLVLISGNFDLSVAATAAISAASVLLLSDTIGIYPAMAVALLAGAAIGLVNGAIVQGLGINAFIVTLATMTALRGVLLIITGGRTASASDREAVAPLKWIENGFWQAPNLLWCAAAVALIAGVLSWRRQKRTIALSCAAATVVLLVAGYFFDASWPLAKPVYYMAAVTAIAWCVTRYTMIGRRLQAVGANPEAARLLGIGINRYRVVPFALNGLGCVFCRPFVRGTAGRGAAERHVGHGTDGDHRGDPRRNVAVRRVGQRSQIGHRRDRALQPRQRLRHPRPRHQLPGRDRRRGAHHRRGDLHDRQSRAPRLTINEHAIKE